MKTLLQMNTIFLSMIMEAVPFVLAGVLISGVIQTFVTERWLARIMPRNRWASSLFGCGVGALFPSCECGIIPVAGRLLNKGMPLNAGIAFILTAPIINPIVLFATYVAFGNNWTIAAVRAGMAIVVAFLVSIAISFLFPQLPMRGRQESDQTPAAQTAAAAETAAPMREPARKSPMSQLNEVFLHSIEEFFSVGKYLVAGALIAACIQTYVPTAYLLHLGNNPVAASLLMIGLAFVMSLCSAADAFIAASFRSTFGIGALSAFLVFGPMVDIKNTFMMLSIFKGKFVATLIALVVVFTLLGSLIAGRLFG